MDITFIDQHVSNGKSAPMSLAKFYDTIFVQNYSVSDRIFKIPIYDIFLKYRTQFEEAVTLYQVSKSQLYQPKSVSLEIYGTTEMWLPLLRLNGMRSIAEFNLIVIKAYEPNTINELIEIFFKREGKIS